ncbi:MAG TPA: DUF4142 domain-containing protein [Gemmatimonadaceae bacterium]|jgi:putative membrane protein|nr:DUF4142 domain-containing protein [Gemmatimonadaceae bacterium]
MIPHARSLALLFAIGLAVPVVAGAQIPVSKEVPPPPPAPAPVDTMQPAVTPPPAAMAPVDTQTRVVEVSSGDLELYRGATDANIISHVLVDDSLEIEMSQLALSRASNAAVREYAQMMITEHSQNRTYFTEMQAKESIGIAPMVNDPIANQAMNAITRLNSLTGEEFDRAYMRAQVAHHDAEVAALTWMAENSRDDDIEEDFEGKLIPTIRMHLTRAREVSAQVGADVSQFRMTP